MGVPGLLSWLDNASKKTVDIRVNVKGAVTAYFFDMNSLLHDVAKAINVDFNNVSAYGDAVVAAVTAIIDKVQKPKYLFLCVDGAPPIAKLVDQRYRRYKAASTVPRYDAGFHITVGTQFMIKFDMYMKDWVARGASFLSDNIIYSGHMVPGEGEYKIFQYIRSNKYPTDGSYIIEGADADLLIISMALGSSKQLLLHRPLPIKDKGKGKERGEYVSSGKIRDYIPKPMTFVVLSMFVGNDFLPGTPTTTTLRQCMNFLYDLSKDKAYDGIIDAKGEVNWLRYLPLLRKMSESEEYLMSERSKEEIAAARRETSPGQKEHKHQYLPGITEPTFELFRIEWYRSSVAPLKQVNQEYIDDMCRRWLRMFQWCMRYYVAGTYTEEYYPYRVAPTLHDLYAYLSKLNDPKTVLGVPYVDRYPIPIHPLAQLACVIPPEYSRVIPEGEIADIVSSKSVSGFSDLLPMQVTIDMRGIFAWNDHAAKPKMSAPDFNRWRRYVAGMTKDEPSPFESAVEKTGILRSGTRTIVNAEFSESEDWNALMSEPL